MIRTSSLLALIILSLPLFQCFAQQPVPKSRGIGSATGTIVDSETKKGLASATISIWRSSDSIVVAGAISKTDGSFTISGIEPGRYYAKASYVGYSPRVVANVTITTNIPVQLGTIALMIDTLQLNGVTVSAARDFLTVAVDRNIYKTDDLIVSKGGNAADVLRNIPSVEVDVDGNVSLRGNSNVVVQVNGRPVMMTGTALANYLQSLPADAIEHVEVIANPSVRYDPKGMGGILNLELKKGGDRGLSGGVNAGVGTKNSYNLGGNISYGGGPWNLSANYGFNTGNRDFLAYRIQQDQRQALGPTLTAADTGLNRFTGHSLNTNIEYSLDKQQSISLSSRVSTHDGGGDRTTTSTTTDGGGAKIDALLRLNSDTRTGLDMDHELAYRWKITKNQELNATVGYNSSAETEATTTSLSNVMHPGPGDGPSLQNVSVQQSEISRTGELSYKHPLSDNITVEGGYSGSLRTVDNTYNGHSAYELVPQLPPSDLTNTFRFDENIHALYGVFDVDMDKVAIEIGLRGETASTLFTLTKTGENYSNNYTNIYPSVFISYKPTDESQFRLGYSKRVERPEGEDLNPFSTSTDPTYLRIGNPYLLPEYTHAVELSLNQFFPFGTIMLTPYFRRTVDRIMRYEHVDSAGVVTSTHENFGRADAYGAEMIATAKSGDWLTFTANTSLYRQVIDASNVVPGAQSDALVWTARLNGTAQLGWGTSLQGSIFYRSPSDVPGGHNDARIMTDMAVQKSLLDDRARIGIRISDVLNSSRNRSWRETDGYYIENERSWGGRMAMLTFSYSFGASKDGARDKKALQSQDPGARD